MKMAKISRENVSRALEEPHSHSFVILTTSVDYNSWQESEKGLRLAASLDKDVVLAEGTKTKWTAKFH